MSYDITASDLNTSGLQADVGLNLVVDWITNQPKSEIKAMLELNSKSPDEINKLIDGIPLAGRLIVNQIKPEMLRKVADVLDDLLIVLNSSFSEDEIAILKASNDSFQLLSIILRTVIKAFSFSAEHTESQKDELVDKFIALISMLKIKK